VENVSLVYCNYGLRDYKTKPIIINTRGYWEFQLTLSGNNKLTKLGNEPKTWKDNHNFWISTPDSTHGWTSTDREPSEITVFHFSEVPESLSRIFQGRKTISASVDLKSLASILLMANEMAPQVLSPGYSSILEFEICCRQLCILFLRNYEDRLESIPWNHHIQVVSASIAWYCAHMNEGIGIQETAEKMGYSVSQLRKIFIKTRGIGPNKIFENCRMNRAKELIQHGTMSIIDISMECGYSNQSSFSRAFKKYYDQTPINLKKNTIPMY
jgi:AraC-like DNA-binding protein